MHVKFVRVRKIFRTQVFAGFTVFAFCDFERRKLCSRLLFHLNLFINRLLTSAFVLAMMN